jgi:tetratricopeptide (TPR) repeat protein
MQPQHRHDARQRLRYILEIELRFRERHELLADMVRRGEADLIDTQFYLFPNLLRWNGAAAVSQCERFYANDPDDANIGAALGRYRVGQGRLDDATAMLEALRRKHPGHLLAAAALLSCDDERRDWDRMARDASGLPPATDSDPWLLSTMRGRLAMHRNEFDQAARHFERLLRDDPANAEASAALVEIYERLNLKERRDEQLQRMRGLARLRSLLGEVQEHPEDPKPLREVAAVCEGIGLTSHAQLVAQLADKAAAATGSSR